MCDPGSVWFGCGLRAMERFERFRLSVPAVPLWKGLSAHLQHSYKGEARFRFLKTVPTVPVPLLVLGKMVPMVPVSGSGSVPAPSCWG